MLKYSNQMKNIWTIVGLIGATAVLGLFFMYMARHMGITESKTETASVVAQSAQTEAQPATEVPVVAPLPTEPFPVMIFAFHSVEPYTGRETALQKQYKISPENFKKELAIIKEKGYTPITLGQAVSDYKAGKVSTEKNVVITFDDGDQNQYDYALPLLKEFNFPATFFIYTLVLDHKKFMTWDEVLALDKSGMEIGAHTHTHAMLTKITDPAVMTAEIGTSRKAIEDKLGHAISLFAYPFYAHTTEVEHAIEKEGYTSAVAGWVAKDKKNNLFALERIEVGNDVNAFARFLK
jgi:peptidoglycan/xylan/chitin deacetylase (PgdA/CDA1 family)